jgi:hypothetical protein
MGRWEAYLTIPAGNRRADGVEDEHRRHVVGGQEVGLLDQLAGELPSPRRRRCRGTRIAEIVDLRPERASKLSQLGRRCLTCAAFQLSQSGDSDGRGVRKGSEAQAPMLAPGADGALAIENRRSQLEWDHAPLRLRQGRVERTDILQLFNHRFNVANLSGPP